MKEKKSLLAITPTSDPRTIEKQLSKDAHLICAGDLRLEAHIRSPLKSGDLGVNHDRDIEASQQDED